MIAREGKDFRDGVFYRLSRAKAHMNLHAQSLHKLKANKILPCRREGRQEDPFIVKEVLLLLDE